LDVDAHDGWMISKMETIDDLSNTPDLPAFTVFTLCLRGKAPKKFGSHPKTLYVSALHLPAHQMDHLGFREPELDVDGFEGCAVF
jgi:hypothetical protein